MSRVLAFSCPHAPCMLKEFPNFLYAQALKWRVDRVICLGDVCDNRVLNFHARNPDLPGPSNEYDEAVKQVARLHKMFPDIDCLIGNHDALPTRQAQVVGIPSWFMKNMAECWDTPSWTWHPRYTTLEIDGVLYRHGDKGRGGNVRPALLNAQRNFQPLVQGHFHALLQVMWEFNLTKGIFGMQVGCGMDHRRAEMEYALTFDLKPAIGCGIIIDGEHAYVERMKR